MASQASPAAAVPTPPIPHSMRVDPTGRVVLPEVPDDLLHRWREDRAGLEAELSEAAARHVSDLAVRDRRISALMTLINDGYTIGNDLRGLVYLFEKAVVEDGPDTPLTTASHIVIDCIRTMAARLESLETQAHATRNFEGPAS